MKKIFLAVVVALFSINAMAQHEIGGIVGGMNGASYKYWFNDAVALQADLAVGLTQAAGQAGAGGQYDFTINPNAEYHWALPVDNLKIYAGGGLNFGLCSAIQNTNPNGLLGKFGINAIAGLQYDLASVPLALAFDFRPGYGMSFRNAAGHFFDWKIAFAVRYKL
jgi:hypothetical protein